MESVAKNMLENGRTMLRSLGERGVEKNFLKLDQYQVTPNRMLSDYVLLQGYRNLINELESEEFTDVKQQIVAEIVMFETELIKRNLLEEACAI